MDNQMDLLNVMEYIDPAELDYQGWVNVGMALQQEGYPCSVWDSWSQRDPAQIPCRRVREKMEVVSWGIYSCYRRDHYPDGA